MGQIPTGMIRVFVDYDLIGIPHPSVDVSVIEGRDAEIVFIEPETVPITASQGKDVIGAKAQSKTPMFIGAVEVKARAVPPVGIVARSFAVWMEMRQIRVAFRISKLRCGAARFLSCGVCT